MKNSVMIMVLSGVGLMLLLSQCAYNEIPEPTIVLPEDSVSFALDVQPIFEAACIQCHDSDGPSPDLTAASAYASLISGDYIDTAMPESSDLVTKISGSSGHKEATAQELALIIQWIDEGAKDN